MDDPPGQEHRWQVTLNKFGRTRWNALLPEQVLKMNTAEVHPPHGWPRTLALALSLLLSLTLCFSGVSAQSDDHSTVSTASPAANAPPTYTLDQVLQGIRSRDAKYRATPLRIEYSHTVSHTRGQPPQKTECTLIIRGNNFRHEVRDAEGRQGWEYRANGLRAEVGRRWKGFDTILPLNGADSQELGDRIYYHAHNSGFNCESTVALLVDGIEPWRTAHFREADKAGNLKITSAEINGIPCVQLSAGGAVACLAPQYDWSIVRSYDLTARGFRRFGARWFPTTLERARTLHDFQGDFFTYRETCEIRTVVETEAPRPDFWRIPEPRPGTWVKVAYPGWSTKWEADLGPTVTKQRLLDCVRSEHAFAWPPTGKAARIYETSRHWRDRTRLDRALNAEVSPTEAPPALLPFMSADGEQIVWARYEPARQRLVMLDSAPTAEPPPDPSHSPDGPKTN